MSKGTCAVDGCGRERKYKSREYCDAHLWRWTKHGDPGGPYIRPLRAPKPACIVEGCQQLRFCRQLCTKHYQRLRKNSTLDRKPQKNGSDHHEWRGDNIGYRAAHARVKKRRGPARQHICIDCGASARHWSYDHSDHNELFNTNGHPYSVDPDRYQPRCVPCHTRLDLDHSANRNAVIVHRPRKETPC